MIEKNINTININRKESNWFCGLVDHSGNFVLDRRTNKLYFEIKIFNKNASQFLITFLEKNIVKGQLETFDENYEYYSYKVYDYFVIKNYIFPLLHNDQSFFENQKYKSKAKYKLLTHKYFQALFAEEFINNIISNKINDEFTDINKMPSSWSPFLIDGLNDLYPSKNEKQQLIFNEFLKYLLFFYPRDNNLTHDSSLLFQKYFLNPYIEKKKNNNENYSDWMTKFFDSGWSKGFFENSIRFDIRFKGVKRIHKSPSREFSLILYNQNPFDLLCYIILLKINNMNLQSKKELPIFKQIKKNNINFFKVICCNNQSCESIVNSLAASSILQTVDEIHENKSSKSININNVKPTFHGYTEKLYTIWAKWPSEEKTKKIKNQQKIFCYLELKKLKNLYYNGK